MKNYFRSLSREWVYVWNGASSPSNQLGTVLAYLKLPSINIQNVVIQLILKNPCLGTAEAIFLWISSLICALCIRDLIPTLITAKGVLTIASNLQLKTSCLHTNWLFNFLSLFLISLLNFVVGWQYGRIETPSPPPIFLQFSCLLSHLWQLYHEHTLKFLLMGA